MWGSAALLLLAVNAGPLKRSFRTVFLVDRDARCAPTDARLASIERGRQFLLDHPEGAALTQGNLTPRLVRRPEVYQVGDFHGPAVPEARYVFMEKPPHGLPYPSSVARFKALIAVWRTQAEQTIIDDEHVLLLKGRFAPDQ